MIVTSELSAYISQALQHLVFRGNPDNIPTTDTCPECGADFDIRVDAMSDNDGAHLVLELPGDVFAVLVGCEGYWVVNPNLLGIVSPNWQPIALGDEVTGVHDATCNGGSACVCGPDWDRPATMD